MVAEVLLTLLSELRRTAVVNNLTRLLEEASPGRSWALGLLPEHKAGRKIELVRGGPQDAQPAEQSCVASAAVEQQLPICSESPEDLARCYAPTIATEQGSALAFPVIGPGRVIGALELYGALPEATLARVGVIVEGLGPALINARRYDLQCGQSRHDDTTGLLNVRALRESLHTEVARAERFGHPVSMLFVDLDHFKEVNDRYGHSVGSALLREVAHRLEAGVRRIDSTFRYGGDEFALLLVQTDLAGAKQTALRIHSLFDQATFREPGGDELALNLSIGVASYPDDGENAEELLKAADRAMYVAKQRGRGRIIGTDDL